MKNNIVLEKSFNFALRVVKLYRYLVDEKKEYTLSKELLVAGTHIGKHVKEGVNAESRDVFISEFGKARRKASEAEYWLQLIKHAELISEREFESIESDMVEVNKLITSIVSTSRINA